MSVRRKKRLRWPFTNLTILFIGSILTIALTLNPQFQYLISHLGSWGYLGAFLAGALYVVSFTAPLGLIILFALSQLHSPVEIALLAALGAVLGDLFIFQFFKNNLKDELDIVYRFFGGNHLTKILQTPYFGWTLPLIGTLIIASPLPDEIGVSLLGLSTMKTLPFMALSFLINFLGLILVLTLSRVV